MKLIEFYDNNTVELYDLGKDPGEQKDLAATMPEKAAQLRRMLDEWRRRVTSERPRYAQEETKTANRRARK